MGYQEGLLYLPIRGRRVLHVLKEMTVFEGLQWLPWLRPQVQGDGEEAGKGWSITGHREL